MYREYQAPDAVAPVVACLWEQEPAGDHVQRVVPDGCVDLIWLAGRELVVAGPDTRFRDVALPAGAMSSGVRLRPGAAGVVLGVPACDVRDLQIDVDLLWGGQASRKRGDSTAELRGRLVEAAPARRLELLVDMVTRRATARPDPLVRAAVRRLTHPGARVSVVAAELGVGERQLHRRMLGAVGYGPKIFARVARLRRLVTLTQRPPAPPSVPAGRPVAEWAAQSPGRTSPGSSSFSLASVAVAAGYASQSHMNDEVRRLTGTTAVRFLEDAIVTAA
ncbi:AraC-type DNA-binding protein [Parafrankia irregularis]|uniref:AraC-type DNA-binding protein n=1 Tax=Parafrankia irregularis TaxID=795642 RepID=A0A0S4QPR8_9ACTN|nr:helix-turn-helix transcriptional regulator [Parafrankia sp. CH37]CUU57600.1 AraC-type DNA-binding protein [Parafrankia irregularis]